MKKILILFSILSLVGLKSTLAEGNWFTVGHHYEYDMKISQDEAVHFDIVYDEAANATVHLTNVPVSSTAINSFVFGNKDELDLEGNVLSIAVTDNITYHTIKLANGADDPVCAGSGPKVTISCGCEGGSSGSSCSVETNWTQGGYKVSCKNNGCSSCLISKDMPPIIKARKVIFE